MSLGTPTRSLKYANEAQTPPLLLPPPGTASLSLEASSPDSTSARCETSVPDPPSIIDPHTTLSAASTNGVTLGSEFAYGSASSAPNPLRGLDAPFGPPLDANFDTASPFEASFHAAA